MAKLRFPVIVAERILDSASSPPTEIRSCEIENGNLAGGPESTRDTHPHCQDYALGITTLRGVWTEDRALTTLSYWPRVLEMLNAAFMALCCSTGFWYQGLKLGVD